MSDNDDLDVRSLRERVKELERENRELEAGLTGRLPARADKEEIDFQIRALEARKLTVDEGAYRAAMESARSVEEITEVAERFGRLHHFE
jgi:hypothetical protein